MRAHEILASLARLANDNVPIAIAWHAAIAALLLALWRGWRPQRRWFAMGLAAPLVSVAALAWAAGNPFNGALFTLLAGAVAWLGSRAPREPLARPPKATTLAGALLVAFAWVYPHFLASGTPWAYLWAAPVGLIPCPTLALVLGLAMIAGLPGGRAWRRSLVAAAVFYGVVGVLWLGVAIDLVLIAGAGAFALASRVRPTRPGRSPHRAARSRARGDRRRHA